MTSSSSSALQNTLSSCAVQIWKVVSNCVSQRTNYNQEGNITTLTYFSYALVVVIHWKLQEGSKLFDKHVHGGRQLASGLGLLVLGWHLLNSGLVVCFGGFCLVNCIVAVGRGRWRWQLNLFHMWLVWNFSQTCCPCLLRQFITLKRGSCWRLMGFDVSLARVIKISV